MPNGKNKVSMEKYLLDVGADEDEIEELTKMIKFWNVKPYNKYGKNVRLIDGQISVEENPRKT